MLLVMKWYRSSHYLNRKDKDSHKFSIIKNIFNRR